MGRNLGSRRSARLTGCAETPKGKEQRQRASAISEPQPEVGGLHGRHSYASPIWGVLANHVYNALLTGRRALELVGADVQRAVHGAALVRVSRPVLSSTTRLAPPAVT